MEGRFVSEAGACIKNLKTYELAPRVEFPDYSFGQFLRGDSRISKDDTQRIDFCIVTDSHEAPR
jgi:hypothetical protein